jgi:hypothetical protein
LPPERSLDLGLTKGGDYYRNSDAKLKRCALGQRARPHRSRPDVDGRRARAPISAWSGPATRSPLPSNRGRHTTTSTRARRARAEPGLCEDLHLGIVAWNRAASVVLADYEALPVEQRNGLRLVFCNHHVREAMLNWERDAQFVVAAFRAETARAGATRNVEAMVDELCRVSPEFAAMWHNNDVRATYGEGPKHIRHPLAGLIALEYSAFAVDGRPDLGMVIYNPATAADADKVRSLVTRQTSPSKITQSTRVRARTEARPAQPAWNPF